MMIPPSFCFHFTAEQRELQEKIRGKGIVVASWKTGQPIVKYNPRGEDDEAAVGQQ